MSPNEQAFLDMIARSEGTSSDVNHSTRRDGFDVIVTGSDGKSEIFTDFSTHPFANGRAPKVINSHGLTSSASGRYQFLRTNWAHYRDLLRLPDFSPASQDKWALQLIRECRALPMIEAGQFAQAVAACAHLWASLPGQGYPGQHQNQLAALQAIYIMAGGTIA